jgi:hypothetical protein
MIVAGVVSMCVGLLSLLASAVQLGRVLQRQDQAENAAKLTTVAISSVTLVALL